MQNKIANLALLEAIGLSQEEINKLEYGAAMHRRYSNISFKIKEVTDKQIIIQVIQGRTPSKNYADKQRLIETVHALFDKHAGNRKVIVQPKVYEETPVNEVDASWINDHMLTLGTKLKDIEADTGLNKTQLSALINGNKPISQVTKAMFFYYFAFKNNSNLTPGITVSRKP